MKYICERRQMMCHSLWISDGHFNPSIFQKIIFFFWWTIFKVFLEFVTILLLFYVLVSWLSAVWDLRPLTGDWTCRPSIGRWSLNHWTTRNVPFYPFLSASYCIDIPNILWLCFFFLNDPPMLTKTASYFHLSVLISLGKSEGLNEDQMVVS